MLRTSTSIAIVGALALAACNKDSKDAKAKDPAPSAEPAPAKAKVDEPAPGPAPAAADACAAAVEHIAKIGAPAGVTVDVATETASCRAETWPPPFLSCAATATDFATYADRCTKAAFPPDTRLEIKRTFDGLVDNSSASPPAGSQDGDFMVYSRAERCGLLWVHRKPVEAGYLLCGDTLMAGPLTTPAEIEEVFAEFARLSAAGHELQLDLMKKWPTGRTVRVYDEVGNYVGEKVE